MFVTKLRRLRRQLDSRKQKSFAFILCQYCIAASLSFSKMTMFSNTDEEQLIVIFLGTDCSSETRICKNNLQMNTKIWFLVHLAWWYKITISSFAQWLLVASSVPSHQLNARNWSFGTHWLLWDVAVIMKVQYLHSWHRFNNWAISVKLRSRKCHRTLLMTWQYWYENWLGAVMQLVITRANVGPDVCCHMVLLGNTELKRSVIESAWNAKLLVNSLLEIFWKNIFLHTFCPCTT